MVSFGTVEQHVGESNGGESFLFNHYATTNETTYGSHWSGFQPTIKPGNGAGYVTNIRPVLQFHPGLDALDNPCMIEALKDTYVTTNQSAYQPFKSKKGSESLPRALHFPKETYYGKPAVHSLPSKKISDAFPTEAFRRAEINAHCFHRPLLHKIHNKDLITSENNNNGPGMWSTSYKTEFVEKTSDTGPIDIRRTGIKESTGFILNNKTVDTLLGLPHSCFASDKPGWSTSRPTGPTSYESDFSPYTCKSVDVGNGGPRLILNDGYTMGNKEEVEFHPKQDKAFLPADKLPFSKMDDLRKGNRPEYWNAYHGTKHPSMYACEFTEQPRAERSRVPDASESELRKREETGASHNVRPWLEGKPCAPDQFVTDNMTNYYWTAPRTRQGYTNMNIIPPDISGFKNNNVLTEFECQTESLKKLSELRNYQGKSIIKREEIVTAPQRMLV